VILNFEMVLDDTRWKETRLYVACLAFESNARCATMSLSRKMTSTPHVDVEELKRELLGDLKHILKSQEIQFPDIIGVMRE
jgi:hypothetical protein